MICWASWLISASVMNSRSRLHRPRSIICQRLKYWISDLTSMWYFFRVTQLEGLTALSVSVVSHGLQGHLHTAQFWAVADRRSTLWKNGGDIFSVCSKSAFLHPTTRLVWRLPCWSFAQRLPDIILWQSQKSYDSGTPYIYYPIKMQLKMTVMFLT